MMASLSQAPILSKAGAKWLTARWSICWACHAAAFWLCLVAPVSYLSTMFVLFSCVPGSLLASRLHLHPSDPSCGGLIGVEDIWLSGIAWALFYGVVLVVWRRWSIRRTGRTASRIHLA